MLRLLLALIALACVSGANYKFMETSACEKVASESSCTSTSGCSWCKSGAVGASCMDSKDAAALPASVFTCEDAVKSTAAKVDATKDNYFFLKTSECEKVASESSCTDSSGCSWCKSGAVGASCMDASDAAALPSSVFICTDSKSLTSEKSGYKGFGIYPENDGTLSPSTASCLASSEYASFVVARGYRDGLSADTNGVTDFCPSLENAKTAGIPDRHVHMEPDSKGPKSAATQIGELKAALDGCRYVTCGSGSPFLSHPILYSIPPKHHTDKDHYSTSSLTPYPMSLQCIQRQNLARCTEHGGMEPRSLHQQKLVHRTCECLQK